MHHSEISKLKLLLTENSGHVGDPIPQMAENLLAKILQDVVVSELEKPLVEYIVAICAATGFTLDEVERQLEVLEEYDADKLSIVWQGVESTKSGAENPYANVSVEDMLFKAGQDIGNEMDDTPDSLHARKLYEGFYAFFTDVSEESNPYSPSVESELWVDGFRFAESIS